MKALVVGAGSNGLVCAIALAAAGLDVEVLEHAPQPGGATSSFERDGFVHDHCAGFNPMTVASPAMRELELGVDWVDPPCVMAHPFGDGSAIALWRDVEATAASLEAVAPGAGAAWRREAALPVARLVEAVLAPLGSVRPVLALGRDAPGLLVRCLRSVESLGRRLFGDAERPTAWLSATAQHTGLPPAMPGSAAFALILQLLGHSHGWPFPRGGQQRLADALVARLEAEGGRARCDAHVERIELHGGHVCGVHLRGGEQVRADVVVATVSVWPLLRMLPPRTLPRHLVDWRYGTAAFKVDYALDAPVPWAAPAAREAAVVHVGGELDELALAAGDARRGVPPAAPALVVGQHTLFDASRAPTGGHTLYVYAHVPPGADALAPIEAQLERFAPGFASHVVHRMVRDAAKTERENPSLVGGDLAGGDTTLDQQLFLRPAPSLARGRTPVDGLYVAGASVHPGAAVHGMSGRQAARAVLRDLRAARRRRAARARRERS